MIKAALCMEDMYTMGASNTYVSIILACIFECYHSRSRRKLETDSTAKQR